jgi:hypothetical protein
LPSPKYCAVKSCNHGRDLGFLLPNLFNTSVSFHGINEFLLWNAANDYTEGVDYTPKADKEKVEANLLILFYLLLPSLYLL